METRLFLYDSSYIYFRYFETGDKSIQNNIFFLPRILKSFPNLVA